MAGTLTLDIEGGDLLTLSARPTTSKLAFVSKGGTGAIAMNGISGPQGIPGPRGPAGDIDADVPDLVVLFENGLI